VGEGKEMKKQYVAMAGLKGYLPNYSDIFDTKEDAVDALLDLHEIDHCSEVADHLTEFGYSDLNLEVNGNEYAEIVELEMEG